MRRIYKLLEIVNDDLTKHLLEKIINVKNEHDKTLIVKFSFQISKRMKKLKLAGLNLIVDFHDDVRDLWIKECEIFGRGIAL